jgi:hypothetical protein
LMAGPPHILATPLHKGFLLNPLAAVSFGVGSLDELNAAGRCFVEELHHLVDLLKLPRLAECGASSGNLGAVVESASNKTSRSVSPRRKSGAFCSIGSSWNGSLDLL